MGSKSKEQIESRSAVLKPRQEPRIQNGLECIWGNANLGPGDLKKLIKMPKCLTLGNLPKGRLYSGKMTLSMILYMHN